MCGSGHCFSEEEKSKLKEKGWAEEQINFAEGSVIENQIKKSI